MHFEFLLFKFHELYFHQLHYITFFYFCLIQISNIFNISLTFCHFHLVNSAQIGSFFLFIFWTNYLILIFSLKIFHKIFFSFHIGVFKGLSFFLYLPFFPCFFLGILYNFYIFLLVLLYSLSTQKTLYFSQTSLFHFLLIHCDFAQMQSFFLYTLHIFLRYFFNLNTFTFCLSFQMYFFFILAFCFSRTNP